MSLFWFYVAKLSEIPDITINNGWEKKYLNTKDKLAGKGLDF